MYLSILRAKDVFKINGLIFPIKFSSFLAYAQFLGQMKVLTAFPSKISKQTKNTQT